MRFLYAIIGLIGGVLLLAAAYVFFLFAMFMGGGTGLQASIVPFVILAFAIAALLNLVAAFLDPRRSAPRLLLASTGIWLLAALAFVSVPADGPAITLLDRLKLTAMMTCPALLPLAVWGLARWQFRAA